MIILAYIGVAVAWVLMVCLMQGFPFALFRNWKCVGKMKGYELCQSGLVAMWQIAAFAPTAKTLFDHIWGQRT